ncbi:beta-propeller fold lactonase family protein [Exilibacterium tricleocarpae]|uniref:Beta-propeller fold lactonase family protein n=1 Tax=Exilibacterium tricleocarpae TaxID=2591008 RepID=A0A545SS57_9GAMM|nr:beta-propeller fold lactonase family protein [Exilibacterium tricleocarpae]TQV67807.1 beta-propeller fold lactonase family protein [Exilibacterium tricleocarpae]
MITKAILAIAILKNVVLQRAAPKKIAVGVIAFFVSIFSYADQGVQESEATAVVRNYLYTVSNVAGDNSIIGYRVRANGSLRELAGSPFPTGGSGAGAVIFNQAGLVASEDERFLFAVNPGSNSISVMEVRGNGSLRPLIGSPFSSGGVFPVSIALRGDLLYVSHLGTDFSTCEFCDIRGFRVNINGRAVTASPLPEATVSFDVNPPRVPFAIGFNPAGDVLVAARFPFSPQPPETSNIDTFQVDSVTGRLTPAPGSPSVSQDPQPIGFGFRPTNPTQLLISNVVAINEQPGSMSSYLMAETGQIAPIVDESFPSGGQEATCWVEFTSNGRYVFATNTFSDSITTYEMDEAGLLRIIEVEPVPNEASVEAWPLEIVISNDDSYIYTVHGQGGYVSSYETTDGRIEALRSQPGPLPPGSQPFGLVYMSK